MYDDGVDVYGVFIEILEVFCVFEMFLEWFVVEFLVYFGNYW